MTNEGNRQTKSARNKLELAAKITDIAQLIAALAFYCGRLKPGEWVSLGKAHGGRLRCPYLKAARRVLDVRNNGDDYKLPRNYRQRLRAVGLDVLLAPGEGEAFSALNSDLDINDAVKELSARHPKVLEKVRLALEYGFPQAKNETKPADDDSQEESDPNEPAGSGSPKLSRERLYQPPGNYQSTKVYQPEIIYSPSDKTGPIASLGSFAAIKKLLNRPEIG